MEELKRIVATTLTETETILYKDSNGAIIKTIALSNKNESDNQVTLEIDGVTFFIQLLAKETKFLHSVIVVNNLKGIGKGVNIHVSGIQLGGV